VEKRRLSVYFLYLGFTWRIWKRVVSLAVTGNTISSRVSALQGDGVSEASTAINRLVGKTYGW
jgi:hypothetical protein